MSTSQKASRKNTDIKFLDIGHLPLYNEDLKAPDEPLEVQQLRKELQEADAILISTCQYNFSISPALKNAIDWPSVGVNEW
ncbi:hypothetical protein WJX84_006309 [Apatococcus fuscideae]|uniref:NAD(P)H dehydrogenase (quinone) n=1 Tax=Apatococcus fuscideae TaxID=2026836 RepID=A0AAW1SRN0_9CHLO